jgi:1-acyl-sn-glycerol-3-phosphate acyltransferase
MGLLRAFVKLGLLPFTVLPAFLGVLVAEPLMSVAPRAGKRLHRLSIALWSKGSLRILGVRTTSVGPAPAPPFFLVANHLSYVDILVLHSLLEGRFLAKQEIARWPIMGVMSRAGGTLYTDRSRHRDLTRVLAEVRRSLARGIGLIVFAEATSTKGAKVLRFKPGLFEVAIETDTPVSYAALSYATPAHVAPAHLSVCWWGDTPFGSHFFRFLMLPRVDATVAFGDSPIREQDRKALARKAHEAVAARFTPSVVT